MHISTNRLLASLLGLLITISPLAGQSEIECQSATKLHAEQEFIQELFARLGEATHAAGGPSIGADPNSLQSRVRAALSECQANGGRLNSCGNYKRIRDAWLTNNAGGSPGAAMVTDPQTCEIAVPDGESYRTVDPAADRPAGGFEQANWDSRYEHEKYHQANCRRLNGSGSNYQQGGPPSPYRQRMNDPRRLAEEEGFAHGITKGILKDYLKDNCFDPDLSVDAEDMVGVCGESPSAVATIKSSAQQAMSWVVNTPNDWFDIPVTGPVTTPPDGESKVDLEGTCYCCEAITKEGEVRVYGGPGHSILLGTDITRMGCTANNTCAGLSGDPHLRTYDGLRFDFQGAGEFVLARGEAFEVQARMEAWRSSRPVSTGTAVAVRVNGDVVGFYTGKTSRLLVLGLERTIDAGGSIRLPGGGLITRDERRYRLTSPDGFVLEVRAGTTRSLNLKIGLPINTKSVGLLGNFDGDTTNDIRAAAGSLLAQPVPFETLYKVFGAGWRVTAETSLFDYAAGESAATFHDLSFPSERVQARNVSGADRRKAESVCRQAGVTGSINIEDCILDVGLTGDAEFAEIAAEQPPDTTRLEISGDPSGATPSGPRAPADPAPSSTADGVSLVAPSEAFASHAVTIGIKGPVQPNYHVGIAPLGSDSSGRAVNPYSERKIRNGQDVELVVPIIPGDYELRYMDDSRERRILLRQPFRSLDPKVRIEAPASVAAGERFEVRVIGNVGEHMYIAVVPVGSPDELHGDSRGTLKQGTDVTSRILYPPKEPGNYEIRCSSNWGGEQKQVHARKRLTIH